MMSLHLALCDDDPFFLASLGDALKNIAAQQQIDFDLHIFQSGEAFLAYLKNKPPIDIFFLDIELPDFDGISLGHQIRSDYNQAHIVYMSHLIDYAPSVFQTGSKGFLTKPLQIQQLHSLMTRLLKEIDDNCQYYTFYLNGLSKALLLESIYYFEVISKSIYLHTRQDCYIYKDSLGNIAEELLPHGFVQPHRSYLVNSSHVVRRTSSSLLLRNGVEIPLSRGRKKALELQFMKNLSPFEDSL